ncbi:MAG: extradiol ring-cleavage dioxygenase, partial [Hyphomonadaceae bacterium]
AFKPDFVLIWGDDQYENFREDIIPPYCVNAYDKFEFHSPPNNIWGESVEKTFTLQGVPKVGRQMATHLLEDGFDCAYAYKPLHHNLGHAFANAIMYLDYNRVGFPYPILPVAINCYGRRVISQRGGGPSLDRVLSADELDPPAPTPKRLFDMGGSIARFLKDSPYRVAILASSGWSHAFLTEKNYFLWPDTPADRKLYNALRDGDYQTWRNYPAAAIEDSGQQEVLNWMCLAGAMNELKMKPSTAETGMLTTWIFNSSKTFMINPKQAA